ncbi:RICIN domain-containing protein, partial [Streptosporangium sp. NPDC050855]|uniref:RICIN domain-containing protein n=1 Tax=Streptosporangium sp. NPDC050855 TaxID=3366194 RepID=UPI003797D2CF
MPYPEEYDMQPFPDRPAHRPARRRSSRPAAVAAVVAALATVPVTVLTWAAPASAATTPLIGTASGRCLDVANVSQANGALAQIWDCNGRPNQQWTSTAAQE